MKQMHLDAFVFLFTLTFCSSQRLLFRCDFDAGLSNSCVFDIEVGAPTMVAVSGAPATALPTQPLSDVNSILSITTPNDEFCQFPYTTPPATWANYFCQQNSPVNYTCPTASGTGNCAAGQYGLITTQRTGPVDYRYTMRKPVQNHTNDYQCLDFYYYMTNGLLNAEISAGWSAGFAPYPISTALPQSENKWHQHRYTYPNPEQSDYYIWFQILRDGGNLGFSFALDEIQVFDGPCESPTTMLLETTVSSTQTTSIDSTVHWTSSLDGVSITQLFNTTIESLPATEISTANPTNEPIVLLNNTEFTVLSSSPVTSPMTNTSTLTVTHSPTVSNNTPDLSLILGLTLGLGLPVVSLIILTLVYYYKIVVPKRKVFVHRSDTNEMLIRSSTNVVNATDTIDAVLI